MKTTKTILYSFFVASVCVMQFSCGDHQEKSTTETTNAQQEKSQKPTPIEYGLPTPYPDFTMLAEDAKSIYSLSGQNPPKLKLTEKIISIAAFKAYLQSSKNNLEGFRIYPGYNDTNAVLIICLAETVDHGFEQTYVVLNATGPQPDSLAISDSSKYSSDRIQSLHNKFFDSVLINGSNQDTNKKQSRLYTIEDFSRLEFDNQAFHPKYVKIVYGYISNSNSDRLATRLNNAGLKLPNITSSQMEGFTTLIYLLNASGQELIDVTDTSSNPTTYTNRALEVGTPCPPRCGSLNH